MAIISFSACCEDLIFHINTTEYTVPSVGNYTYIQTEQFSGCVLVYSTTSIGDEYGYIDNSGLFNDCEECQETHLCIPCEDRSVTFTTQTISPSPTPSITPTPTPSVNRDLNITGNGTYVINDGYFVCSNVARLVSCDRNNIFYVNLPIIYSGSPINVGEVINVVIDAETYCVTFVESIIGSSSHYITTINSVHVNCEDCEP